MRIGIFALLVAVPVFGADITPDTVSYTHLISAS